MYCTNCGAQFDGKFCPECGKAAAEKVGDKLYIGDPDETDKLLEKPKRTGAIVLLSILLCSLLVCGIVLVNLSKSRSIPSGGQPATQSNVLDLSGEWRQTGGASDDNYQIATIKDGTIEIFWVNETTDTKSIYWSGTYIAPTEAVKEYNWTSSANKEKLDTALLASLDDTKAFTYSNGQLSYDASAMGMTQTVKLEKQ